MVRSRAVYLALAVLADGSGDVLGIWIEQTEGAKFRMKVFSDLRTRGCHDILIVAVTDGLQGMSEAMTAVYPATTLQTCIVHLLRNSLEFANWKERKPLAAALRPIYTAASADAALLVLDAFERGPWGVRFPTVVAAWRRAWTHVNPFFTFPPDVRRVIYTTNALESVHARLRKIIKTRGHFPNNEAAKKLLWLALRNITATWVRPHLEGGHESVRDPVRGPLHRPESVECVGPKPRMDAAALWTPRTRPQGLGKPLENAVSHSAPTRIVVGVEGKINSRRPRDDQ